MRTLTYLIVAATYQEQKHDPREHDGPVLSQDSIHCRNNRYRHSGSGQYPLGKVGGYTLARAYGQTKRQASRDDTHGCTISPACREQRLLCSTARTVHSSMWVGAGRCHQLTPEICDAWHMRG
ncbi:unnamed protein product, partial [Iphiclides podalirius]